MNLDASFNDKFRLTNKNVKAIFARPHTKAFADAHLLRTKKLQLSNEFMDSMAIERYCKRKLYKQ